MVTILVLSPLISPPGSPLPHQPLPCATLTTLLLPLCPSPPSGSSPPSPALALCQPHHTPDAPLPFPSPQGPPLPHQPWPYASLTALLLPRNPLLGDTACEVLAEALRQAGCRLRERDLGRWGGRGLGNRGRLHMMSDSMLSTRVMGEVASLLFPPDPPSFSSPHPPPCIPPPLLRCCLGERSAGALGAALAVTNSLQLLDLSWNNLGVRGRWDA